MIASLTECNCSSPLSGYGREGAMRRMAAAVQGMGRAAGAAVLIALAGCNTSNTPDWGFSNLLPKTGASAVARLEQRNGSVVTGTLSFVQRGDKVALAAVVQNLGPGRHSMYIHEKGNRTSPNSPARAGSGSSRVRLRVERASACCRNSSPTARDRRAS